MITCVVGGTVTYTPFPDYAAEVRIGPMVMPGGAAFGTVWLIDSPLFGLPPPPPLRFVSHGYVIG